MSGEYEEINSDPNIIHIYNNYHRLHLR